MGPRVLSSNRGHAAIPAFSNDFRAFSLTSWAFNRTHLKEIRFKGTNYIGSSYIAFPIVFAGC